jgi:hypothetical protein
MTIRPHNLAIREVSDEELAEVIGHIDLENVHRYDIECSVEQSRRRARDTIALAIAQGIRDELIPIEVIQDWLELMLRSDGSA